ncbi:MAG: BMP family ABC transporter substrate-binding protein [Selenomonadaceae bacterium]|nr:BMP family ABC transporter substrate-binding protein [Selenomonadaceae bacterium]
MQINSNKRWLRALFILGGLIIVAIVCVLSFAFDVSVEDKNQERIGLLLIDSNNNEEWKKIQYNSLKEVCYEIGAVLLDRQSVTENAVNFKLMISELVNEGAKMIFVTTPTNTLPREYFAEEYPNVDFATNSVDYREKNLTPYLVRMYQGRWLSGILAGMKTKTNVIGYVASLPDSLINLEINAFALGVQRVNPNAEVIVMWTGDWNNAEIEEEHTKRLVNEANADIITYHQNDRTVADTAEALNVDFIGYNDNLEGYSEHRLTSVVCRWDIYYRDIINRYLKGELNHNNDRWLDINSGSVVLTNYSDLVTPEMHNKVESLRQELLQGNNIFSGDIYDNEGVQHCADGETISDKALLFRTNWLVRGVKVLE